MTLVASGQPVPPNVQLAPWIPLHLRKPDSARPPEPADTPRLGFGNQSSIGALQGEERTPPQKIWVRRQWNIPKEAKNGPKFVRKALVLSVCNDRGFFEKNDRGAYSINGLTAKPDPDGSFAIQFGACLRETLDLRLYDRERLSARLAAGAPQMRLTVTPIEPVPSSLRLITRGDAPFTGSGCRRTRQAAARHARGFCGGNSCERLRTVF